VEKIVETGARSCRSWPVEARPDTTSWSTSRRRSLSSTRRVATLSNAAVGERRTFPRGRRRGEGRAGVHGRSRPELPPACGVSAGRRRARSRARPRSPVYRTYLAPRFPGRLQDQDAAAHGGAPRLPRRRLRCATRRPHRPSSWVRFQQTTGAVMAKGHRRHRDVPRTCGCWRLNEVGGDPDRFGLSVAEIPSDESTPTRVVASRVPRCDHPRHEAQRPNGAGHALRCSSTMGFAVARSPSDGGGARCARARERRGAHRIADEELFALQDGWWERGRYRGSASTGIW